MRRRGPLGPIAEAQRVRIAPAGPIEENPRSLNLDTWELFEPESRMERRSFRIQVEISP